MSSILLLDGAMGSMLLSAGLETGGMPDLWNITQPGIVQSVHQAYRDAGADIITTNTFGANPARLKANGLDPSITTKINQEAVRLAREAAGHSQVAGDIGPTGMLLEPVGPLRKEDALVSFRVQAEALAAGDVDLLLLETFFSLDEALLALQAVKEVCAIPVWVSLTFRKTRRGFFTIHGDKPLESLRVLLGHGVQKAGANCTLSSADMKILAKELCQQLGDRVFLQPNAGEPRVVDRTIIYPESPAEFAGNMLDMVASGAEAVGGCCGTTPDHIRELHDALQGRHT